MRMTLALIPTLRDLPSEAVIPSHQLLLKAGFIQKTAAGMYNYLPLGKRVLDKIEKIVRREMNRYGGQEILMPIVQPSELWKESERWDAYGEEMWRLRDRHNREFCLGPTHEEIVTDLVRQTIGSYKSLPLRLYQIQNKYRDERRPRFGLMRGREFIMKDLYSFDLTEEGLDAAYQDMYQAYCHVFDACGLRYRPVLADSGQIGGGYTHEFMVLAENGEATIAYCDKCEYAANAEIAECFTRPHFEKQTSEDKNIEKIATPNIVTIDELAAFLDCQREQCIKTVLYQADDELIAVLTLGHHSVNDLKVQKVHPCANLVMADDSTIVKKIGAHPGSLGPIGLPSDIPIYADRALEGLKDGISGANENDFHLININLLRDTTIKDFYDLREIEEGDCCPECHNRIKFIRGIEVGQVFKLGLKYSESMNAKVLDENGKTRHLLMGCYGIGVSRTMAAAVEQNHDENGIVWPKSIAPYHVHLIVVDVKNQEQLELGNQIYEDLTNQDIDVLFDDRKERVGVKFNDADLIGIPLRITVGRKSVEVGEVEWTTRSNKETSMCSVDKLVKEIKAYYHL